MTRLEPAANDAAPMTSRSRDDAIPDEEEAPVARPSAAPGSGETAGFDALLLTLFADVSDRAPWDRFLRLLCDHLGGAAATLVLRQPARGDRGDLFDVNTVPALVEIYRTTTFDDDPFATLETGVVANLFDRITPGRLRRSRYYNELLKLDDITDILALNVAFGDAYVGSLKIARRGSPTPFGLAEKSLVLRLYPHLQAALEIYERSRRQLIENKAYIVAFDQLAFGVIILDERGHIVRINETAAALIAETRLLRVAGNMLKAGSLEQASRIDTAIARALAADSQSGPATRSLRLGDQTPANSIYLLLRPIIDDRGSGAPMGVAVFLSAGTLHRSVGIASCAALFGISPAENALLSELMDGASITVAANALGISEHTARTQLRSIFAKTGTHRQADLFRLVLTSLAIIA